MAISPKIVDSVSKPLKSKIANVVSCVARSENKNGREEAWVSLILDNNKPILVREFKREDWSSEAWAQAVKYSKRLAEQLGVRALKRRAEDFA